MMIISKKIKTIASIVLPIALFVFFSVRSMKESSDQRHLKEMMIGLSHSKISSIELFFFHNYKLTNIMYQLRKDEIETFKSYLKQTDLEQVGGHNSPKYECLLLLKLENGSKLDLVGIVYSAYEFNIDALYIYPDFFVKDKSGEFIPRNPKKPVRVQGLGKWMMEKFPAKGP